MDPHLPSLRKGSAQRGAEPGPSGSSRAPSPAEETLERMSSPPHRQVSRAAGLSTSTRYLGLSEAEEQRVHEAAAQILQRSLARREAAERSGAAIRSLAESFAALWYADRLGGAALQAQRTGPEAPETPRLMLEIAVDLLRDPAFVQALGIEPAEAAEDIDYLERWIEGGQRSMAWRSQQGYGSEQFLMRREVRGGSLSERVDQVVADKLKQRGDPHAPSDVREHLTHLLEAVPVGAPIPVTVMTPEAAHRIYAVVQRQPGEPGVQLELWNLGWGALAGSRAQMVQPCGVFHFSDEAGAGRALLWLLSFGAGYEPDSPLNGTVAQIAMESHGIQRERLGELWAQHRESKSPHRLDDLDRHLVDLATECGVLSTPPMAREEKAQRSGSCVAKGLRAFYQAERGGSDAPQSRHLMALLDAIAAALLARSTDLERYAITPAEKQQMRSLLADMTAPYRHWKSLQHADLPEKLLRGAARWICDTERPAPTAPTSVSQTPFRRTEIQPAAGAEQPQGRPSAADWQSIATEGERAPQPAQVLEQVERALSEDPKEACALWEAFKKSESDYGFNYVLSARRRWELCSACRGVLDPAGLKTLIVERGLNLLEPLLAMQDLDTLFAAALSLPIQQSLESLQIALALTPRPGCNPAVWAEADRAWTWLPLPHGRLPLYPEEPSSWRAYDLRQRSAKALQTALRDWILRQSSLRPLFSSKVVAEGASLADLWNAIAAVADHWPPELAAQGQILRRLEQQRPAFGTEEFMQLTTQRFLHRLMPMSLMQRTNAMTLLQAEGMQPLAQGIAMETGGLAALLLTSVETRQPFVAIDSMAAWTPPLQIPEPGEAPIVQGNLLLLGGYAAWSAWLLVAQQALERADLMVLEETELANLTEVVIAGIGPTPNPTERELLRRWRELLLLQVHRAPDLAPGVLALSLLLLGPNPSSEQLSPSSMLGAAQLSFARAVWKLNGLTSALPYCQRWHDLRRACGEPDPVVTIADVAFDLAAGQPVARRRPGAAELKLETMTSLPVGFRRVFDPTVGSSVLVWDKDPQLGLRLIPDGAIMQARWTGTNGQPKQAWIVDLTLGVSPSGNPQLPRWPQRANEMQPLVPSPMPLGSGLLLWSGSEPPSGALQPRLREELQQLSGIFELASLVESDGDHLRYSILRPSTLQPTATLTPLPHAWCLDLPDGEQIPLESSWSWGGLRAVGEHPPPAGAGARAVLQDLWILGRPIRGTVTTTGPGQEPALTLENGWRIAPEARAELPEWLARLPSGRLNLAIPLVRGAERGLLLGAVREGKLEHPTRGEALILRVRPSGDLDLDPETGPESAVFCLNHLSKWAPHVAARVLQLLIDGQPPLSFEAEWELARMTRSLAQESGLILGPIAEELASRRTDWLHGLRAPQSSSGLSAHRPPTSVVAMRIDQNVRPQHPRERADSLETLPDLPQADPEAIEGLGRAALLARSETGEPERLERTLEELCALLADGAKRATEELEQALQLSPSDQSYLRAVAGTMRVPSLLQVWFRCEQVGSMQPWRARFPQLSSQGALQLQQGLRQFVLARLRLQGARQALEIARQQGRGSLLSEGSLTQAGDSRLQASLKALHARLTGALPSALIRQEWLRELLGRPAQVETLMAWAGNADHPHQLLEVKMGGGKTALLNPTMALEMAAQAKRADPAQPASVFVIVPDALEEDARHLCFQQGWDLMGQSLPFLGSQASAFQVLSESRQAALEGLPMTLTQSAWSFAWLDVLERSRQLALAGEPSSKGLQRTIAELERLSNASLLIDEADQALALDQSFNLEVSDPKPLSGSLLRALHLLADFQSRAGRSLLDPLGDEDRLALLRSAAPASWSDARKEQAARALLFGDEPPPCSLPEQSPLVAMALLTGEARRGACSLKWNLDYGPSSPAALDVVPYQQAFWPTDQTFSDPFLTALLTLWQAQVPEFWTAARVATLLPILQDAVSEYPQHAERLLALGLPSDYGHQPEMLRDVLQQVNRGPLRLALGELICAHAEGPTSVLRLQATGAPLRGSRCIASTGTAPPVSRTPTALLAGEPPAGATRDTHPVQAGAPHPGILESARVTRAPSLERGVQIETPQALIDPCGLLDPRAAALLALRMADPMAPENPVALTWSAGTATSAPKLSRVLTDGSLGPPPPPALLAIAPKVVVYQQAQCRGTDIRPREGEQGLLWVERPLPLRDLQQAAGRLRGLSPTGGSQPSQTLTIGLGPEMQRLVDQLQKDQPSLTDLQALLQICQEHEAIQQARWLPELLRQDLLNIRQAFVCWLLRHPEQASLAPAVSRELIASLVEPYRVPSMQELVQGASRRDHPADLRASLLQEAEALVQKMTVLAPPSSPEAQGLRTELERLMRRMTLAPADCFSQDLPPLASGGMRRAQEADQEGRVAAGQQAQAAAHLEAKAAASIEQLSEMSMCRAWILPALATLRIRAQWSDERDEVDVRGLQSGELFTDSTGIVGFGEWWNQTLLQGREPLLPLEFRYSPAALLPFARSADDALPGSPISEPLGVDLPVNDERRLLPQILHLHTRKGWQACLLAPQEVAEMQSQHPVRWRHLANQGRLVVTTLAGRALEGLYGADLENKELAQDSLKTLGLSLHASQTRADLLKLRALYGTPMEELDPAQEHENLRWLQHHPAWAEVWLGISPASLRAGRARWLQTRSED